MGKYNGGGIQQLPDAVADDGMLDISLVRPVHFWHLLFRFHNLFNGEHLRASATSSSERGSTHPHRVLARNRRSSSTASCWAHTPLEFTMLRRAIRVVVSREFLEFME